MLVVLLCITEAIACVAEDKNCVVAVIAAN